MFINVKNDATHLRVLKFCAQAISFILPKTSLDRQWILPKKFLVDEDIQNMAAGFNWGIQMIQNSQVKLGTRRHT